MNKKGFIPVMVIIIVLFIIGWLIIVNVYVPYREVKMSISYNKEVRWKCVNNSLTENKNIEEWGLTGGDCFNNFEGFHKYKLSCNNDILMITCYKTIYDKYFKEK